MAEKYYKIGGTRLTQLADAIRAKTENDYELSPADMVEELNALNIKLQEKHVTVNGGSETDIYPDDGYYGLSYVTVVAGGGGGGGWDDDDEDLPNAETTDFGYTYETEIVYSGKYFYGTMPTGWPLPPIPVHEGFPYIVMYKTAPQGISGNVWYYIEYSSTPFYTKIAESGDTCVYRSLPEDEEGEGAPYYRQTSLSRWQNNGYGEPTGYTKSTNITGSADLNDVNESNGGYGRLCWSTDALKTATGIAPTGIVPEVVGEVPIGAPVDRESRYTIKGSTLNSLAYYIQRMGGDGELLTPGGMVSTLGSIYGAIETGG